MQPNREGMEAILPLELTQMSWQSIVGEMDLNNRLLPGSGANHA